jgi:hypothetical protein
MLNDGIKGYNVKKKKKCECWNSYKCMYIVQIH